MQLLLLVILLVSLISSPQIHFLSAAAAGPISDHERMGEASKVLSAGIEVEGFVFPATVSLPSSHKPLFLGGAGTRGLLIDGRFIVFSAIGVYLGEEAVPSLAGKWKGKSPEELARSVDFYRDIFSGPFEKFTKVTLVLPLTGQQYSEKVAENCVNYMKSVGTYTEAEAAAVEKFKEVFETEVFPHGASILFTHSCSGSLKIAFAKEGNSSDATAAVIDNRPLSEAVLESIIGEHGVSPATKESLASRFSLLLNDPNCAGEN